MGGFRIETLIDAPAERVFDAARDIDLHVESMAHTDETAIAGRTAGKIELGESVTWQARHIGLVMQLTSKITVFDPPRRFVDEQVSGPFAGFRHEHRFDPAGDRTIMVDEWEHTSPFGLLGRIVDAVVLDRYLRRQLRARARTIRIAAERAALA